LTVDPREKTMAVPNDMDSCVGTVRERPVKCTADVGRDSCHPQHDVILFRTPEHLPSSVTQDLNQFDAAILCFSIGRVPSDLSAGLLDLRNQHIGGQVR